jgi:hypothetical protein
MKRRVVEEAVEVVDRIASPCDVVALRYAHRFLAAGSALSAGGTIMGTRGIFVMGAESDSALVGFELRLGRRALFDEILRVSIAIAG